MLRKVRYAKIQIAKQHKCEKWETESRYITNNKWVCDKRVNDELTQVILLF